ncbi:RNase A-like domain-containing protein [Burkholderia dolosa]|uniref:RNase A-like domain-containing protein n=1 Tax=Burkholderia dolosa TaxID=152500 RepID=UPI001B93D2E6|nr:hypothetical protein [Burkholderia dolosa]MBR8458628.1 hypothetical protein [Burkholderia dolosa]MDN7422808.1 hypothetical protein [Burkholderia dolosa]
MDSPRCRRSQKYPLRFASSFIDLQTAERAISEVMRAQALQIERWASSATRNSTLRIIGDVGHTVGYTLARGAGTVSNSTKIMIIAKMTAYNEMPYFILTAFLL